MGATGAWSPAVSHTPSASVCGPEPDPLLPLCRALARIATRRAAEQVRKGAGHEAGELRAVAGRL